MKRPKRTITLLSLAAADDTATSGSAHATPACTCTVKATVY